MSQDFAPIATQAWDPVFTPTMQGVEILANSTHEAIGFGGYAYNRRIADTSEMFETGYTASNFIPTPLNPTNVNILYRVFRLQHVISDNQLRQIGQSRESYANYAVEVAKNHGVAAGRTKDNVKIQAMYNATVGTNIPVTYGGSNNGLTGVKITSARDKIQSFGALAGDFTLIASVSNRALMLEDDKMSRSNYGSMNTYHVPAGLPRPVMQFDPQTQIRFTSDVGTGSLGFTTASGVRTFTCLMWNRDAVTFAIDMQPATVIEYVAHQACTVIRTEMICGAKVVKPNGVAKILANDI